MYAVTIPYRVLGESLMTLLYTRTQLALPCAVFATTLSSRAVHFIQTGDSALSNTYYCLP